VSPVPGEGRKQENYFLFYFFRKIMKIRRKIRQFMSTFSKTNSFYIFDHFIFICTTSYVFSYFSLILSTGPTARVRTICLSPSALSSHMLHGKPQTFPVAWFLTTTFSKNHPAPMPLSLCPIRIAVRSPTSRSRDIKER
jgi:hypothetical protein